MVALRTPKAEIGWQASDFNLPGTDGKQYTLADVRGPNGLVVMFICNHCPFVQAILDKILRDAKELQALGIGVVAISANDAEEYPEDSPENMRKLAEAKGFTFPYLHDASQQVARAYDAICTPDFFGFNSDLKLQYRGRLDDSSMQHKPGGERELFTAMKQVAETGKALAPQNPSIGCSIKWCH
ncbi:MAG: thioredoxin family protein [Hyphomicrobiales bacterium]|nr:thioredoxin family protein [Rickettsiales bacterium]MCP5361284.1 thioredoxin family protein [Hyphomicrobiales bacterium]